MGPGLVVGHARAGCAKTKAAAGCGAIPCCEARVARASTACQGRMLRGSKKLHDGASISVEGIEGSHRDVTVAILTEHTI